MIFPKQNFRRILLFVGVTLLLLAGACCLLLLSQDSGPNLTRDNVRKIKPGMSFTEVKEVVGARPRFSAGQDAPQGKSRWITAHGWISDDAELTVLFDEEGKVVGRRYFPPAGHPSPVADRLINQAKYQWRLFWK